MVMWMIIDYFIYRHEAVMESLGAGLPEVEEITADTPALSDLGTRIERLFNEEQIFLNLSLRFQGLRVRLIIMPL